MNFRLFMNLERVVPSRHHDWVLFLGSADLDRDKLAFNPYFFPVLNFAYAGVFKLFGKIILRQLLLVLGVGDKFEIVLFVFSFIPNHGVGEMLQRSKLILIKLALLNIIEDNNIVSLIITYNRIYSFLFTQIDNNSRAAS